MLSAQTGAMQKVTGVLVPVVCVFALRAAASGGCAPTLPPAGGRRTRWLLHSTNNSKIPAAQKGSGGFGAGGGTRTHTLSPGTDFESVTSTIPSHRRICKSSFILRCFHHTGEYTIYMFKQYITSPRKFQDEFPGVQHFCMAALGGCRVPHTVPGRGMARSVRTRPRHSSDPASQAGTGMSSRLRLRLREKR